MPVRLLRNHAGTSLADVFIAISILGIVAASALPNLNPKRMHINAAQRLVISQLRLARSHAITRNVHYLVQFPTTTQVRVARMVESAEGVWAADAEQAHVMDLPSGTALSNANVGRSFQFNTRGMTVNLTEPVRIDLADSFGVTKSLQAWPSGQINEL
jgi:Tfp pilus assembly protein FimT